jgi:hypothetical protein
MLLPAASEAIRSSTNLLEISACCAEDFGKSRPKYPPVLEIPFKAMV